MDTLKLILTIIQLISVVLIVIVSFQSGKDAAPAPAFRHVDDRYILRKEQIQFNERSSQGLRNGSPWTFIVLMLVLNLIGCRSVHVEGGGPDPLYQYLRRNGRPRYEGPKRCAAERAAALTRNPALI